MRRSLFLVIAVCASQLVFGWGKNGHLIVGEIAEMHMTQKTKDAVKAILGDESVADAGIWMDAVMNEKEYRNQDNWHYAYQDATLEANAVMKLQEFTELLKNSEAPQEEKLLALRAIIHIAGDVHVPLHCGYTKDKGGHKGSLKWEESGEKTNMHKVWDTDMIHMYQTDVNTYAKTLNDAITKEEINTWSTIDFNVWVTESQELLDQVYDHPSKNLSASYYNQNIIVVNDRLSMSGIRLAFLLNSIFDPN